MAQYRIYLSEDYLIERARHYHRAQLPKQLWRILLNVVCYVVLAVLVGVCIYAKVIVPGILFRSFLLLLLVGPHLNDWIMKRRFRKSPFYNDDEVIGIGFSEEGIKIQNVMENMELKWSYLTRVYRLRDGFLAFTTNRCHYYWLPDSALEEGSVADVERLFAKFVAEHNLGAGCVLNVLP